MGRRDDIKVPEGTAPNGRMEKTSFARSMIRYFEEALYQGVNEALPDTMEELPEDMVLWFRNGG